MWSSCVFHVLPQSLVLVWTIHLMSHLIRENAFLLIFFFIWRVLSFHNQPRLDLRVIVSMCFFKGIICRIHDLVWCHVGCQLSSQFLPFIFSVLKCFWCCFLSQFSHRGYTTFHVVTAQFPLRTNISQRLDRWLWNFVQMSWFTGNEAYWLLWCPTLQFSTMRFTSLVLVKCLTICWMDCCNIWYR